MEICFLKLICGNCCKTSRDLYFLLHKEYYNCGRSCISPEKVYIFSKAEVTSYLMTYSVFKSFWFIAPKTLFNTTATPQANFTTSENLYFQR